MQPSMRRVGRGRTGPIVRIPATWTPGWREVVVFVVLAVLAHLAGWGGPLGEEFNR